MISRMVSTLASARTCPACSSCRCSASNCAGASPGPGAEDRRATERGCAAGLPPLPPLSLLSLDDDTPTQTGQCVLSYALIICLCNVCIDTL